LLPPADPPTPVPIPADPHTHHGHGGAVDAPLPASQGNGPVEWGDLTSWQPSPGWLMVIAALAAGYASRWAGTWATS
jgi:hypothetical protein